MLESDAETIERSIALAVVGDSISGVGAGGVIVIEVEGGETVP
jgi:hypothetical protein